mmetsp:Transcript_10593/g.21767  ORF Transcript_10593/g.21767 Transcript_10593/m.21767 type:complete len:275 (+) Transcript_10593:126-950(+)
MSPFWCSRTTFSIFLYWAIMSSTSLALAISSSSIMVSVLRTSASMAWILAMPSLLIFSTFMSSVCDSRRWPWAWEVFTEAAFRRWLVFSSYLLRLLSASLAAISASAFFSSWLVMLPCAVLISSCAFWNFDTSLSTSSRAVVALATSLRAFPALATQVFIFWASRSSWRDSLRSFSSLSVALVISLFTLSGDWTIWEASFFSSACPSWMAMEMVAFLSFKSLAFFLSSPDSCLMAACCLLRAPILVSISAHSSSTCSMILTSPADCCFSCSNCP